MFPNELFSEKTLIKQLNIEDALTATQFPASGSFIDVSGFHKFGFLIGAGALNSALTCKVQQATANNGTLKDITDATVTIAATGDDKWYWIEVETTHLDSNNDYRYVALDVAGAAGGDDYGAIFFFGFAIDRPVTQGADKGSVVTVAG